MKNLTLIAAAGLAASMLPTAHALQFSFASTGNSQLVFTGATALHHSSQDATFTLRSSTLNDPSKGFDFEINNTLNDSSHPSATGDMGILNAQFALTGYTDAVMAIPAGFLHLETATATAVGSPELMIMDAGYNPFLGINAPANANHIYRAGSVFANITQVYLVQAGGRKSFSADGISDDTLTLNLSSGHYTGHEADLIALASQAATISLGWSWNGLSLGSMLALNAGNHAVSLNGSLNSPSNVPDARNTFWLMALALAGLAGARHVGMRQA